MSPELTALWNEAVQADIDYDELACEPPAFPAVCWKDTAAMAIDELSTVTTELQAAKALIAQLQAAFGIPCVTLVGRK